MSWGTLLQTHRQVKTSETWRPLKLVSLHHEKEETFKVEEVKTVIVVFRRKSRMEFLKFLPSTQETNLLPPRHRFTSSSHRFHKQSCDHVSHTVTSSRHVEPTGREEPPQSQTRDGHWWTLMLQWRQRGRLVQYQRSLFVHCDVRGDVRDAERQRGQRGQQPSASLYNWSHFKLDSSDLHSLLSDCFFISGVRTFLWRWRRWEARWFFVFFCRPYLTPCWPSPSCLNPRMHCCSVQEKDKRDLLRVSCQTAARLRPAVPCCPRRADETIRSRDVLFETLHRQSFSHWD